VPDRITTDDAVAWNRILAGGISRAQALRAAGPVGYDGVGQISEIGARGRFQKTSAEQNPLAWKPRHNVVARMTGAWKE
jgi:hypothetical protein